jgi:hypothetical protein
MGNTQSNNTSIPISNNTTAQSPTNYKEIPKERIVVKPKSQVQENLTYTYPSRVNENVALNKMYYDENDRLEQGNALNSYYQFNTTTVIPPAPNNMKNMMNLNSRHIPVNVNSDEIFNRDSNMLRDEWNKKQKPQTNYVNLPNAHIPHYNIDKEQLAGNKKSIPRPELDNIQRSLDEIYRKYKGISSNERRLLVLKNITITEIDPLYILEKRPNITLTDLEQVYMKLRNIHHPDKGGDPNTFIRIQNAIQICKSAKCGSVIDKSYNDLRSGYDEYVRNNEVDINDRSVDNSRFSLEKFNKAFDEYRYRDDLEEHGYGQNMIKSTEDRDDIYIENTIGKFKLNTFNDQFKNSKKKKNNEIIKYQVPESLDASDGIAHVTLGSKQDNFTSSIKSKVNYTDYMDAYTKDNVLVDENTMTNKINKPYKKALKDYKNASLKLTEEQEKAIEEYEEKKKKEEYIRHDRFNQMTLDYEKYEKKMSNFMLK